MVGNITNPYPFILGPGNQGPATGAGFSAIINNLASAVVALAGIGLFLNLLMGGFRYMSAEGDMKALDSAKKMITNSLIGMAIVAAAFFLALMIKAITGFDIRSFMIG